MRHYFTHTLEMGQEKILAHGTREYLALVDVETYPPFVGKEIDHLDLMAHLYGQMKALTAIAWGSPPGTQNLRLVLTENDHAADHVAPSSWHTTASGWLRTNGRLCLTSHDRLHDCARHRTHGLLREEHLPKDSRPRVLNVPPGVYSVLVLYHFHYPFPIETPADRPPVPVPKVPYTVILRHYAFPAPRIAPIRLPGLVPWAA